MTDSSPPGSTSTPRPSAAERYAVMVVDDSAVIRGLITRILEGDSALDVVASVANGRMAVDAIRRRPVDVVVLDIEMPVMDGLEALPLLLQACPGTRVVMASTLTKRNADISLRALAAGAADYVAKPTATRDIHTTDGFAGELLGKVKTLARAARTAGSARTAGAGGAAQSPAVGRRTGFTAERQAPGRPRPTVAALRPPAGPPPPLRDIPAGFRPEILAVGSSTGGPQALFEMLKPLAGALTVPIVVTQHMPPTFTAILAEHIVRQCGVPTAEAVDGEALAPGRCYIAPGDYHMTLALLGGRATIKLSQTPPVNFCRPAVDPMLRSVVEVYGGRVLTVILTGMGQDGMLGCRAVAEAGGAVVAQDEATSVVWGMPGAVTQDGSASLVLPLSEIGPFVRRYAMRAAA